MHVARDDGRQRDRRVEVAAADVGRGIHCTNALRQGQSSGRSNAPGQQLGAAQPGTHRRPLASGRCQRPPRTRAPRHRTAAGRRGRSVVLWVAGAAAIQASTATGDKPPAAAPGQRRRPHTWKMKSPRNSAMSAAHSLRRSLLSMSSRPNCAGERRLGEETQIEPRCPEAHP